MNTDLIYKQNDLVPLIDFGKLPVPGYLCNTKEEAIMQPRFDNSLAISVSSKHVQQKYLSARTLLTEKVYTSYHSTYSASKDLSIYMQRFIKFLIKRLVLSKDDSILEIGSNDGLVVRQIAKLGFFALGIDPSSEEIRDRNLRLMRGFFGKDYASSLGLNEAIKLIFTRHTLEHVYDPVDFLQGAYLLLEENGLLVIEVPYLKSQILRNHFEGMSVQHESFFTISSMKNTLDRAGFKIQDVFFVPMDGGSMVVLASKHNVQSEIVCSLINSEEDEGYTNGDAVKSYAQKFYHFKHNIRNLLESLSEKKEITAFGGGSKGQQLLNVIHPGETINYVLDEFQAKEDVKYIPGCGVEVINLEEAMKRQSPDYILLTAPTHIQILSKKVKSLFPNAKIISTTPFLGSPELEQF